MCGALEFIDSVCGIMHAFRFAYLQAEKAATSMRNHQKTPSLCALPVHVVDPTDLELFAKVKVLQLDVTLDRLIREEEYAMCEARTGERNCEARIVRAKVANP